MHSINHKCLLLIFLCLSFIASAEQWQHEALWQHVKDIEVTDSKEPAVLLADLEQYIVLTKTKGWKDIEILAMSQKASVYTMLGQYEDAKLIVDNYLPLAQKLQDNESKLILLPILLQIHDSKRDLKSAIDIRTQYEVEALASSNKKAIAEMYIQLAASKQTYGEIKASLMDLQKALQISETIQDEKGMGAALNSIAILYDEINDSEQALVYYEKALRIYKDQGTSFSLSVLYFNIGQTFYTLDNKLAATENLNIALNMSSELKDEVGEAFAHRYLGRIAVDQNNYEKANKHFTKALEVFKRFNDNLMHFITILNFADLLSQSGNVDKAIGLLLPLEKEVETFNRPQSLFDYYNKVYQLEKLRNNFKASLIAFEKADKIKHDINSKEKNDSLQELMLKFGTKEKEAENQLLQQQNQLKELQIAEQSAQQTIFVLIITFSVFTLLIISILLFKQILHRNSFKRMALRDELTGAPNRRAIIATAEKRFEQCLAEQSNLTIAMLDIDHFKKFNDNYGHDIGDRVLSIFSDACFESIRSHDRYGRFGGEEWLIVLLDAKESDIEVIFNRLKNALEKVKIKDDLDITLTFSLGAAQLSAKDKNINQLIKRADINLYQAKNNGRDQYVITS